MFLIYARVSICFSLFASKILQDTKVMRLIGPMNGVFEMSITLDLTGWTNIELNLDQVSG